MPLFKKHDNKQANQAADTQGQGAYNDQPGNNAAGVGQSRDYNAAGGATGGHHHHHQQGNVPGSGAAGVGAGAGAGAGYPDQQQQYNTGAGGPGVGAGTGAPGVGGAGYDNNAGVPPANHLNQGQQQGGGGRRFEGKLEHAVGSMVGSQALKNKGIQKEQEAGAFQAQSAEIAEAERLEQEALTRRERAVAHGAHPDNKYLGGGQLGGNPTQQASGNPGAGVGGRTGGY